MSGEVLQIIGLLVLGYVLLLLELFLPGGVLGILGIGSVVYGCWLAFGLGTVWGGGAVLISVVATVGLVVLIMRSRAARRLVLDRHAEFVLHSLEGSLVNCLPNRLAL